MRPDFGVAGIRDGSPDFGKPVGVTDAGPPLTGIPDLTPGGVAVPFTEVTVTLLVAVFGAELSGVDGAVGVAGSGSVGRRERALLVFDAGAGALEVAGPGRDERGVGVASFEGAWMLFEGSDDLSGVAGEADAELKAAGC